MNSSTLLKVREKNAAYKRYLATMDSIDYNAFAQGPRSDFKVGGAEQLWKEVRWGSGKNF